MAEIGEIQGQVTMRIPGHAARELSLLNRYRYLGKSVALVCELGLAVKFGGCCSSEDGKYLQNPDRICPIALSKDRFFEQSLAVRTADIFRFLPLSVCEDVFLALLVMTHFRGSHDSPIAARSSKLCSTVSGVLVQVA